MNDEKKQTLKFFRNLKIFIFSFVAFQNKTNQFFNPNYHQHGRNNLV